MEDAIGGYFGLECRRGAHLHASAVRVNSGRNGLEYLLRVRPARRVFMPDYFCDVVLEPLARLGVEVVFYALDRGLRCSLDPQEIEQDDALVYIDYFGVCKAEVDRLATLGPRLIVDATQAFFREAPPDVELFNSARKFFGVPDGGYVMPGKDAPSLDLERDVAWDRSEYLLKRCDVGAEFGYGAYQESQKSFVARPLRLMSRLTETLMVQIDYKAVRRRRDENFALLHEQLAERNQLQLDMSEIDGPMVYPLWLAEGQTLRQRLIRERIFVATYWPGIEKHAAPGSLAVEWAENLVGLPIDQRYDSGHMKRVLDTLASIID